MVEIKSLRRAYHRKMCEQGIRIRDGKPNLADVANKTSCSVSMKLVELLDCPIGPQSQMSGQTVGGLFERITCEFLKEAFTLLEFLRPGQWHYYVGSSITGFYQYEHLAMLKDLMNQNPALASMLGTEYIITPDILVARVPIDDDKINASRPLVDADVASYTPLRSRNSHSELLHASISCKWTLRSDRSQNTRSEALNLMRLRKGHTPHIVAVVAEPLPTRIASLALGTGDLDCVYHFALPELKQAIDTLGYTDQLDMLEMLIEGRRLRDISDLPFDLAI